MSINLNTIHTELDQHQHCKAFRFSDIDITQNHTLMHHYNLLYFTEDSDDILLDFKAVSCHKGVLLLIGKGQLLKFKDSHNAYKGYWVIFSEARYHNSMDSHITLQQKRCYNHPLYNQIITKKQSDQENIYGSILSLYTENKNDIVFAKTELLELQLAQLLYKCERIIWTNEKHLETKLFSTFLKFHELIVKNHKTCRNALEYAKQLGITYKHLNSICKKTVGITAKDIINQYVVLEIKKVLASGMISTKKLTEAYSFDESTNFIKFFKRYEGITPLQFRKNELV